MINNQSTTQATFIQLIRDTFIGGFVVILPVYLAILALNH